ncbi:transposase [Paenibacillus alvei]|uniref:transposase n=1 Tax=Paenibacillus alvei TaxID=44250 RepID=UPI00227EDF6E|nr:transposase [Paenibacillus alvei]
MRTRKPLRFPNPIWKSIYSTNLIESFNKQIKEYTKRKEQFPHEEALKKIPSDSV